MFKEELYNGKTQNILDEVKAYGRNKTALKYNLAEYTLSYWKKEEFKLIEAKDKNKRITLQKGRKNIYRKLKKNLRILNLTENC